MAYEYSPSTDLVVNAVQIFTGERERDSRVAVWTHASGPSEPDSEMAGEDFLALTDTGWQGARLSEEITLSAGWHYWVSWHAHYGQTSRASMGEYVAYKWSVIGSGTWNGRSEPTKSSDSCTVPTNSTVLGSPPADFRAELRDR